MQCKILQHTVIICHSTGLSSKELFQYFALVMGVILKRYVKQVTVEGNNNKG